MEEVVRWEPSHIDYARSVNVNIAPDMGWSVYLNGYDQEDKLVVTRIYCIDLECYSSNIQQWLKEHE